MSRQNLVKLPGIKFHEIPFSRSQVLTWGQTDRHDKANSRLKRDSLLVCADCVNTLRT